MTSALEQYARGLCCFAFKPHGQRHFGAEMYEALAKERRCMVQFPSSTLGLAETRPVWKSVATKVKSRSHQHISASSVV